MGMIMEADATKQKGCPRKTRQESAKENMKSFGLSEADTWV